jgi:hemerythrin-like metal-binding protein
MPNQHDSDAFNLGVAAMDAAHKNFVTALTQLESLDDRLFCQSFSTWVKTLESDFYNEEKLMDEVDFPDTRNHLEQHAHILSALHHAEPRVMEGDAALGREIIGLLPEWFELHVSTMDRVLATAVLIARDEATTPYILPSAEEG